MIRVNGVLIDQPERGWTLLPDSELFSGVSSVFSRVDVAGRDGSLMLPGKASPAVVSIRVHCSMAMYPALLALFRGQDLTLTRDDFPALSAQGRMLSISTDRVGIAVDWIDVTVVVELPGAYWRAKSLSTAVIPLTAASAQADVLAGMTAPVQDALIRVTGASGVVVTDSAGSWVQFPTVAAGQYVRFDASTGRAYRTTTDTWTGGTEVSGQVDFGGPRTLFEITHVLNPSTLTTTGHLTVTSTTRESGAAVSVRARTAHAI